MHLHLVTYPFIHTFNRDHLKLDEIGIDDKDDTTAIMNITDIAHLPLIQKDGHPPRRRNAYHHWRPRVHRSRSYPLDFPLG